ncbi:MAG: FAD-dependent oxidoreductase, partial [Lactobacillaceae bacterium]|nr:FAD-dependent oxidoreductase [Lactobacillaceae bacterium]
RGERALRSFDEELVSDVVDEMVGRGTDFHFNTEVVKIQKDDMKYVVELSNGEILKVDQVFNTAGRNGNHTELNLDGIGVENDEFEVFVDGYMRTNVPNIYAIGDIAKSGVDKIIPTGTYQGRYVAGLLSGTETEEISYPAIAAVTFTSPRIAKVGVQPVNATKAMEVRSGDYSKWITYYRNHEKALVKSVIGEDGVVLGGTVMALEAEEVINYFVNAINNHDTREKLQKIIYSYPSYGSDMPDFV